MSDEQKGRVRRIRIDPRLLWEWRHQIADIVREVADAEADPRVAQRLREIGARFEAGISRLSDVQLGEQP